MRRSAILLIALTLVVAACGDDASTLFGDSYDTATTTTGDDAGTTSATAADTPETTTPVSLPGGTTDDDQDLPESGQSTPADSEPYDPVTTTSIPPSTTSSTTSSTKPSTTLLGDPRGPVYVDSVELVFMESYPVQVRAIVAGNLPTPCHTADWRVGETGADGSVTLEVFSTVDDPETACIQVLEPFEITADIGSFTTGQYLLVVNGVDYPFTI